MGAHSAVRLLWTTEDMDLNPAISIFIKNIYLLLHVESTKIASQLNEVYRQICHAIMGSFLQ